MPLAGRALPDTFTCSWKGVKMGAGADHIPISVAAPSTFVKCQPFRRLVDCNLPVVRTALNTALF